LTDTGGACGAANVGTCKAGVVTCSSGVLMCQGATPPALETCDGKDNDCNSTTDDNLIDPWVGQACCPTGTLSDCTNTSAGGMTGTRCMAGAFQCASGAKSCVGGTAKTTESCNNTDDDCNGLIDDIPGLGTACNVGGVNTQGVCTATWTC